MSDSATVPSAPAGAAVPLFTRTATGLVRQVSLLQQIVFNLAASNALGLGLVFYLSVVVLFPRSNIYIALLIAGAGSFFVWTTFALLTATIPRIGGDFTINSRVLPPWLALGGNIGGFMSGIFGVPIFGYFMSTLALSPALAVIGGVSGSETLTRWSTYFSASHHTVVFITTLAVVALMSVLSYLGTRVIMRVSTVLLLIAFAGFLIDMVILLFTSHSHFVNSVNGVAGAGAYEKTVNAGASSGLYPDHGYSTKNTIGAVYYALTLCIYIYWGTYLSAEFRQGGQRRRQLASMWGAGFGNLAILMLAIFIFMSTVGYNFFVSAFAGNFNAPGAASGVGSAGYVYFAGLVASNTALVAILGFAFLGWFLPPCYANAAMCHRAFLTWSFHGLLPKWFSNVNDRTHTPGPAILTTALISIPLAVWIAYSNNFFQYFAIAAVSAYPSLVLIGITAALFKRRRPDLYTGSAADWRIGGVAVLPIVGVVCSFVGAAAIFLLFYFHTNVGLKYTTETAIYLGAMFVIALAWWFGARAIQRRQGVDISLAYKTIPPD
jgi:basic amino acid/polyamine antiporter, APA family